MQGILSSPLFACLQAVSTLGERSMANFTIGYDLNGSSPTHKQVDEHIRKGFTICARVLETEWYVVHNGTAAQVRDYMMLILRNEDPRRRETRHPFHARFDAGWPDSSQLPDSPQRSWCYGQRRLYASDWRVCARGSGDHQAFRLTARSRRTAERARASSV